MATADHHEQCIVLTFATLNEDTKLSPVIARYASASKTFRYYITAEALSRSSSFYVMTLPFSRVFSMGYFIIPVVVLILYALASLVLLAEEFENP